MNRICLNMIVKNESNIIKRCLDSVLPYIDSWCIVDTGSTDDTEKIILETLSHLPGNIHKKEWVNFGHNRSEALNSIPDNSCDWILLIDADMILINAGFDKSQLEESIDVYNLVQDTGVLQYSNMRLLNAKHKWHCFGVTHEYYDIPGPYKNQKLLSTLYFNDFADGGSKEDKYERDIRLLSDGLIEQPNNPRYMFYLAQSYKDTGQWENAIYWYQKRVEYGGWEEEQWYSQYMISFCQISMKSPFAIVAESAMKAWIMRPWRNEPLYHCMLYARENEQWTLGYYLSKLAIMNKWPKQDVLFIFKNAYDYHIIDEFSIFAYYNQQYLESKNACVELLMQKIDDIHRPRIEQNLWYAKKALGEYDEVSLDSFISNAQKTV